MNRKLTTGVCIAALALTVCLYAPPARAIPVLTPTVITTNGATTGIDNLLIGQQYYDAQFYPYSALNQTVTLSDLTPPATTAPDSAAAAITAIDTALTNNDVYTVDAAFDPQYSVWTGTSDANGPIFESAIDLSIYAPNPVPPAYWQLEQTSGTGGYVYPSGYVTFNCVSPVPEPNTAVLFLVGLGLICLIGLQQKFKGQIHAA